MGGRDCKNRLEGNMYIYIGVSKNRGFSPKMDDENNGKSY